jgi:hypothetical protein
MGEFCLLIFVVGRITPYTVKDDDNDYGDFKLV